MERYCWLERAWLYQGMRGQCGLNRDFKALCVLCQGFGGFGKSLKMFSIEGSI